MVTGLLPYISEATTNDPLYKLIYLKKKEKFWYSWKLINGKIKIKEKQDSKTKWLKKIRKFCSNAYETMFSCCRNSRRRIMDETSPTTKFK
jgi:hypothetical protein